MDVRSSPRVTIEGGPGWQVDDASPDVIGAEPGPGPRWRPSRAAVVSVALAALLAFAAATLLAHWRHDAAGEIAAATLSVSVWSGGDGDDQPVVVEDGRASLQIPVTLANTGPRPIALLSVRMPGTDIATEDLAGRRLAAGRQLRLALRRPLDCSREPRHVAGEGVAVRLVVRARTGAGPREVEVLAPLYTPLLSRDMAVAMCGDLPPDEALISDVTGRGPIHDRRTVLSLQVSNASRHRLTVEGVRASAPWLSARLVDEDGRAVALPVSLPASDFSTPRQPWQAREGQTWRVELAVPDCSRVPDPFIPDYDGILLEADLDSGTRTGTARFGGGGQDVMLELARLGCAS